MGGLVCVFSLESGLTASAGFVASLVGFGARNLSFVIFSPGVRCLSALITLFVPGHYSVLFVLFGLSYFSIAFVFSLEPPPLISFLRCSSGVSEYNSSFR